ncbi:MAG: hypothetical protein ACLP01_14165 [Solirubrobacteraceae bacterium]
MFRQAVKTPTSTAPIRPVPPPRAHHAKARPNANTNPHAKAYNRGRPPQHRGGHDARRDHLEPHADDHVGTGSLELWRLELIARA